MYSRISISPYTILDIPTCEHKLNFPSAVKAWARTCDGTSVSGEDDDDDDSDDADADEGGINGRRIFCGRKLCTILTIALRKPGLFRITGDVRTISPCRQTEID